MRRDRGWRERLPERRIEVNRSAWGAPARRHRSGRRSAQVAQGGGGRLRQCQIYRPARELPVKILLGNGLQCAPAVQLVRSISGDRDQGNVRDCGFHDRGIEISGRGSGGCNQRRRRSGFFGNSKREKRRASLVDHRPSLEPRLVGAGEGDRRGAGSRTDHRMAHAGRTQPLDERLRPELVEVSRYQPDLRSLREA